MSVSPAQTARPAVAEARSTRAAATPWIPLAVVAAILGASGAARIWQERRVGLALEEGRASPFPLASIPSELGPWEGRDVRMDPRLVRGTGSTDMITRRYVNRATGVAIDLVALYGPTSEMFIHTPELCYPSAGFARESGPTERPVDVGGAGPVPFRALAFRRGEGGLAETQEVYYSLWYDGRWTTASTTPKASQRIPGMYKVQASRRLSPGERPELDDPCEPFVALVVAEIERRRPSARPDAPPGP